MCDAYNSAEREDRRAQVGGTTLPRPGDCGVSGSASPAGRSRLIPTFTDPAHARRRFAEKGSTHALTDFSNARLGQQPRSNKFDKVQCHTCVLAPTFCPDHSLCLSLRSQIFFTPHRQPRTRAILGEKNPSCILQRP